MSFMPHEAVDTPEHDCLLHAGICGTRSTCTTVTCTTLSKSNWGISMVTMTMGICFCVTTEDIDHRITGQLGSLHDPLNSLDHGKRPLHHEKMMTTSTGTSITMSNGNRGFSMIRKTMKRLCATTGMQKNTTGTSTTTCTATGESVKGLPLRRDRKDGDDVDKLQLRNLHSFLHVKCHLGKSGVERHPARELRLVQINVATFTHRPGEHNTIRNWRWAVEASCQHAVGRKTGTRRPTRRRTRDTTEEVVPEVDKHAHEVASRASAKAKKRVEEVASSSSSSSSSRASEYAPGPEAPLHGSELALHSLLVHLLLLLLLCLKAAAVRNRSEEESTTSPAAPASSGTASDGTGAATYPPPLPEARAPQGHPAAHQWLWQSSMSVGRRARLPPPFGDCGGGFLPEPWRRTSAHVWPMSGAVAPCAASQRQRVRTPWHNRQSPQQKNRSAHWCCQP